MRAAHRTARQPILKGLHGKAEKDKSDAENTEPPLGKVVGLVLDVGIHGYPNTGNNASYQSYTNRKRPGMINVMHESTTDKRRSNVANRADDGAPKLASRKAGRRLDT